MLDVLGRRFAFSPRISSWQPALLSEDSNSSRRVSIRVSHSRRFLSQSSRATCMPTARGTDSVPGRMPDCWTPPRRIGESSMPVAYEECADAEWATEFVSGDGHRGGAEILELQRELAGGLGGIGV